MRVELQDRYNRFKLDMDIFMDQIVSYQAETLLDLIAHKDMMGWSEKSHKALALIEYIREIQKGQSEEEHGIRMLMDDNLARFQNAAEYWT